MWSEWILEDEFSSMWGLDSKAVRPPKTVLQGPTSACHIPSGLGGMKQYWRETWNKLKSPAVRGELCGPDLARSKIPIWRNHLQSKGVENWFSVTLFRPPQPHPKTVRCIFCRCMYACRYTEKDLEVYTSNWYQGSGRWIELGLGRGFKGKLGFSETLDGLLSIMLLFPVSYIT